jgi:hypothetical protein
MTELTETFQRLAETMGQITKAMRAWTRSMLFGDLQSLKCPFCQQYSLTYEWMTSTYTCHIYGTKIRAEDMFCGPH